MAADFSHRTIMKRWLSLFALILALPARGAALPDVAIAPNGMHVVINLPQTRLFLYQNGQLLQTFPVAVGKMLTKTPTGDFTVTGIYRNPAWHVPKSIQEEMKKQGKPVQTVVPPGADNPLGPVFIRFGEATLGLGIHGTNAPASVPGFRSHGCVRMKNEDVSQLADILGRGAEVTVTYQTLLLNEDEAGQLWLTAYRDLYRHKDPSLPRLADTLLAWQAERGVAVHGNRVDQALKDRQGRPVCLSCTDARPQVRGQLSAVRWIHPLPGGDAVQPAATQAPRASSQAT